MIELSAQQLSLSFGVRTLFKNVTFQVQTQDKLGLVGVNGSGKSTLFKILAGELPSDTGSVTYRKGLTVGHLSQEAFLYSDRSLYGELLSVFAPVIRIEREMQDTAARMAREEALGDKAHLKALYERYDRLDEEFKKLNGYEVESRVKGTLIGLGFGEERFHEPVASLSGGEKTALALGRLLLTKPDLLLLDEPTNYLDIRALEWLENFLQDFTGAFIIISHDRYFLDRVTTGILDLSEGTVTQYRGNYTAFQQKRQARSDERAHHLAMQQKEIKHLEKVIQTQLHFGQAHNFKTIRNFEKKIDKIELGPGAMEKERTVRLKLQSAPRSGNEVLKVENLSVGFSADQVLSKNLSFSVRRLDRLFILGPNGIGKTTLLKTILGEREKLAGNVIYGAGVRPAYYEQEFSSLNPDKTVLDEVWDEFPREKEADVRAILGRFLFTEDDVFKKVGSLSGGEKSRVALSKLMLKSHNFLLLDEPTNHLDIATKEILEDVLSDYDGTILIISHDRYFTDKLATKILELSKDGAREFIGNYTDWREKLADEARRAELAALEAEAARKKAAPKKPKATAPAPAATGMSEFRRKQQLSEVEQAIFALEEEEKGLMKLFEMPGFFQNEELAKDSNLRYEEVKKELARLYDKWEKLSE